MAWSIERLKKIMRSASTNGGGSSPASSAKAQVVKEYEDQVVSNAVGEIAEKFGAISPELKKLAGHIQATTIATMVAYDNGDDAFKQSLQDAGLIKERDGKQEFNKFFIKDAIKTLDPSISIEETAKATVDILEAKVKAAGITDDQIQQGRDINDSRGGANKNPLASAATPITPIYEFLDSRIGNLSKLITGLHVVTRSGVGRIQTGQMNREIAEKAAKTNFNGKIFENDSASLKRAIRSGTRLNSFELGKDNAFSPLPEDIQNINTLLSETLKGLKDINQEFGDEVDLSALISNTEKYQNITKGWKPELAKTATVGAEQQKAGFSFGSGADAIDVDTLVDPNQLIADQLKAAQEAADKARQNAGRKASADAQKAFSGQEDTTFENLQKQAEIKKAIINGFGKDNVAKKGWDEAEQDGTFAYIAESFDVDYSKAGKSIFTAKDKSYSFEATADGVYHNDTNPDVSPREALQSALLIKMNARAQAEGVTIGGSDEQKYMYFLGLQNGGSDIKVLNQDEIDAIPDHVKAQVTARMDAFLDERKTPEGKPDYAGLAESAVNDNQSAQAAPRTSPNGPQGGTKP